MRKRFYRLIVALSLKHPMTILIAVVILTIASIVSIFYLSINTDIINLLPRHSRTAATLEEALETFKSFDFIFVMVEAKEPKQGELLIQAADILAPALDNPAYIYAVDYTFDHRLATFYMESEGKRLPCLLNKADLDEALNRFNPDQLEQYMVRLARRLQVVSTPEMKKKLLDDPLDLGSLFLKRLMINRGPIPFHLRKGYFMSGNEKMLLMVLRPLEPASDLKFSTDLMRFLDRVREALISSNPDFSGKIDVSYVGSHAETVENTRVVRNDLFQTLITSFVIVILLFFFVFRRRETIVLVGLPLFIGILWTLGLTQLVLGRLTMSTFAMGAVLIGLGIDFAIHIYNRFLEEYHSSELSSIYRSLHIALLQTGEGVLLGAITTAAAFYGMIFTSFPGFKEIGFVAGSGILCCFTSIFFLLPVLIRYLTPRNVPRQKMGMTSFGIPRLYQMVMSYPRLVIILGIVLTVYFAYQARFVRFDENFRALTRPSRSNYEIKQRIGRYFSIPSHQIIAIVSDSTIQGVLEKNDQLYENLKHQTRHPILSCDTLRSFLPSLKTQEQSKKMIRETIGARLDNIKERLLRRSRMQGLAPAALEPFIKRLEFLVQGADNKDNFILYEDLDLPFIIRQVQHYLVKEDYYVASNRKYKVITRIFPPAGQWVSDVPEQFLRLLSKNVGTVEFTGVSIVASEIQKIVKRDLAVVILIVITSVFLILILHFGWLHKTFFAILPVACGSIWMLGTIHILGIQLNFLNVVVIPMIIGVGVDNGIHLMQRYYERGKNPDTKDLKMAVEMTGRALVMTSITTIVGFGSLALANFKGIREMGLLSIFGITYTLAAAIIFLPALLKIWGKRHRLTDLIGRDEDGEIR